MDEKYFDLLLAGLYTIGALAGLGYADIELAGIVLTDTAVVLGGYDIAFHHVMSVVGLAGAWLVNSPSWSRLDGIKRGLFGLAVGILLVSIINPDTITSMVNSFAMAIGILGLQTGGYWAIAHN